MRGLDLATLLPALNTTEPSASGQYLGKTSNRSCGCTLINYDPSGSG